MGRFGVCLGNDSGRSGEDFLVMAKRLIKAFRVIKDAVAYD